MLQLREKHLSDRDLLKAAKEIKAVTQGSGTSLIVNDRPDIALLAEADGVHLGQDDLPVDQVRQIVGSKMIIGLSTHSPSQAREAIAQKPDYIGFGPIYPTTTKAVADPTVGTEQLRAVLSIATIPVVAIGGIFPENLETVLSTGARNVCLVRHLMESTQTEELINQLQQRLNR